MRATEFIIEADTYQPPVLSVGDSILKGKFKNSPAEIKGFTKDKHNQPVLKTNKGEVQLFKPRISKLMKTDESVTISEYDQDSDNSKQIMSKLKALGYAPIGDGYDATVWSKDAGSVIKIIMPQELSRAEGDTSFLTFYEFCTKNKNSPFLPKFISIGGLDHSVFTLNGVDYRQISMEKLAPIANDSFMEQMVWGLSELATMPFMKWQDAKSQLIDPKFWEHFSGPNRENDIIQGLSNPAEEKMYASLFMVMQSLFQFGKSRGMGWDLHTENVMSRGNTPVIIDPFTG